MSGSRNVRISFRVRDRKDVDLILGRGVLAGGWHARALNVPGKFLINVAEHDTPKRVCAYLVTDQAVVGTAAACDGFRPLTRSNPTRRASSRPLFR
jgi:hypothetical protein